LGAQEFIRRFLLHVLPNGFQRIRHYGFLANRYRAVKLARCRQLLAAPEPAVKHLDAPSDYRDRYEQLTGKSLSDCPKCGCGHMVCILPEVRLRSHGLHRNLPAGFLAARASGRDSMNAHTRMLLTVPGTAKRGWGLPLDRTGKRRCDTPLSQPLCPSNPASRPSCILRPDQFRLCLHASHLCQGRASTILLQYNPHSATA